MALKEYKGTKDRKAPPEIKDKKVRLVIQERKEIKGKKDKQVLQEIRVKKAK